MRFSIPSRLKDPEFYIKMTVVFLLAQWVVLITTAINIPLSDEWEYLRPDAFLSGFSWKHVFSFHNEHRNVFSNLWNYLFLHLTGWNLKIQAVVNYFFFCALVFFIMRMQNRLIQKTHVGLWIITFFLTSPFMYENHVSSFQSAFHFFLISGIAGIYLATQMELKSWHYLAASLCGLISIYSFGGGWFFGLTVFLILFYRLITQPEKIFSTITIRILVLLLLVGGMALWFVNYPQNNAHPAFAWPHTPEFWRFYTNLMSFGFGYKSKNDFFAIVAFGFCLYLMIKNFKEAFRFRQHYVSIAFFGALAILGVLASIALSRTGFGLGQSKVPRYGEIAIFLAIFLGWLGWRQVQESARFRKAFKFYVGFATIGFLSSYSYSGYFTVAKVRKAGVKCIQEYYQTREPDKICPTLYPRPISQFLENAEKLDLSWVPDQE